MNKLIDAKDFKEYICWHSPNLEKFNKNLKTY